MSDTPRTPPTDPKSTFGSNVGETAPGVAREAREFAPKAGRAAQEAADQASRAFASGMDTAQARLGDLQDLTHQAHERANERIREHPVTYCAMTFCVGMLAGMLISRR
jgi:ElaB/YqjD/DUF883 family membrane-anchored ribosome-binding protein